MAKSTTPRLGLQRWTADTDSQDRTEFDGAHAQLEQLAAGFLQDEIGDRPAAAAAYAGFLFEATDEDGALYWCTGADWLGPFALVSDLDAAEVVFDPSGTDLESTDVEAAIKEVAAGSATSDVSAALSQSLPAGRYLTSPGLRSATAAAIPINNVWAIPFPLAIGGSVDRIACEVTGAQADTVVRMGIYASGPDGLPGALVVDAGTVSAATTGAKEITLSPAVELAPGFYWLAAVTQGPANPSLTRVAGYGARSGSTSLSRALQDTRPGVMAAGVGGALPDPFGTLGDPTTPNWPLVLVRGA